MTDVNMEELEGNSPILIPRPQRTPQRQQQQQTPRSPTGGIHHTAGRSGQSIKDRLKALLILRTPKLVEAASSNQNKVEAYFTIMQA